MTRIYTWASTFILALSLASVSSSKTRNVKIGLLSEQPGSDLDAPAYLADIPRLVEKAIQDRQKDLKKAGIQLEVESFLVTPSPLAPYTTFEKVLKSDVIAAVGFQSSDEVALTAPLIQGKDFLAITPYATSSELLKLAPNYLMLTASNLEMVRAIEAFVESEFPGKRKTAIVAFDSTYSNNLYSSFNTKFRTETKTYKVVDNTLDGFEAEIPKILEDRPEIVILPNFPVTSASVIKQLVRHGFQGVFVGPDSWGEDSDNRFMKILKDVTFTGYTIRPYSKHNITIRERVFAKEIRTSLDIEFAVAPALYYDSTQYLINVLIRTKGALTRKSVLATAGNYRNYSGIMGNSCLSAPECKQRAFTLLKVTKDGYKFIRTIRGGSIASK